MDWTPIFPSVEETLQDMPKWRSFRDQFNVYMEKVEKEYVSYNRKLEEELIVQERKVVAIEEDKYYSGPQELEMYHYVRQRTPKEWLQYATPHTGRCEEETCNNILDSGYYRLKGYSTKLCGNCFPQLAIWAKREKLYQEETKEEKERRANNSEEWFFVDYEEDKVTKEDIKCMDEECWFSGNMDRLQEYKGHWQLKGDPDSCVCDICFGNMF